LNDVSKITTHLFRENAGKMNAVLTRKFGTAHFELVLDAVQDAFEAALVQWRYGAVPDNPSGWLMLVAKRKILNSLKRESRVEGLSEPYAEADLQDDAIDRTTNGLVDDSQLRLLLACADPSFPMKKQVAFTLHVLCGFGVHEIASALLMEPEAVKKLLFRMKGEFRERLGHSGLPEPSLSDDRIPTVHAVLYLMFNEGYKTTKGASQLNHDMCYEAIRLAKLLLDAGTPEARESNALLALMFFNLSRFPARLDEEGCAVSLEQQNRDKWNRTFIEEGYRYLKDASPADALNRYYVEALISSLHCAAPDFPSTDWKKLLYLYAQLETIAPSAGVALNKIVAMSYCESPHNALVELHRAAENGSVTEDFIYYATLADLHRRCYNLHDAVSAYAEAKRLAPSPSDKLFFDTRMQQCAKN
jgi:RNA polymerase sigma factor (sigma-70 family)